MSAATISTASISILCDREQLLAGFGAVGGVVPARTPKPCLTSVKLVATIGDGTTLAATDLEAGITLRVLGAKVDRPGAVLLPYARVSQILKACRDDEIAIEVDGDTLVIRGDRSVWKLPTEDPGSFPDPPRDLSLESGVSVAGDDLRRAIRRTAFATDQESTRYALSGCQLVIDPDAASFTLTGTDGRRMARQAVGCDPGAVFAVPDPAPVVPAKTLRLIDRNLKSDEPAVVVVDPGKSISVRSGRATIWSRLVEGRYPAVDQVIPASCEARIALPEVGPFLAAVEQAAIVTSKESRGVDFAFAPGRIRMGSQTAGVGESDIEHPLDGYEGDEIAITFDASYLAEALRSLDPNQPLVVELLDHKSAAVFRVTEDGGGWLHVLIPLSKGGGR